MRSQRTVKERSLRRSSEQWTVVVDWGHEMDNIRSYSSLGDTRARCGGHLRGVLLVNVKQNTHTRLHSHALTYMHTIACTRVSPVSALTAHGHTTLHVYRCT